MTDYHPVTKEELETLEQYLTNDYGETKCEDLIKEIASRPDPLAQLQAEYERGFSDGQKGIKHIKTY